MRIVTLTALVLLSACGDGSKDSRNTGAAGNEAAQVAQTASPAGNLDIMPIGKYNISVQVTKMDIPGLSAEDSAMVKADTAEPVTQDMCVTSETLQPVPGINTMEIILTTFMGDITGEGCKFANFSSAGGKISGSLSCANSTYGNLTAGTVTGSITPDETRYAVEGTLSVPKVTDQPIAFANTITMKRTGTCTE